MSSYSDLLFFPSIIHSDCLHEAQIIIAPILPLNLQAYFFSLSLHSHLQEVLNDQIIDFNTQILGQ